VPALIDGAPDLNLGLYVGGAAFTLDDPTLGQLDAGNVLGPTDDGWTDPTCRVLEAHWRTGATDADGPLSRMPSGYCLVRLFDPDREFDPTAAHGPFRNRLNVGTPLRLVAGLATPGPALTDETGAPITDQHREPITVTVDQVSPTPQFTGRLFTASHEAGVTTFEAADGLADLAAYNGPEQAEGPTQTTGERVAKILREASYRGPVRLDAGTEDLQGQTLAQAALTELWRAVDSELGAVWVDRAGVLVFRDRNVWTTPPVWVAQLGPDDACGILTVTEQHLTAEHVRSIVYAASGGHNQEEVIDQAAVDRFGSRRWGRNDLLLRGQAALRRWATEVLLWSKDPRPGAITQLVLNPATAPRLWPLVLRLDPLLCVRLSFSHDTAETPVVVGYAHSVTATDWQVTVIMAPHPLDAVQGHPFTLDDPTAGRLDAGNVLT
jgi:hypothetical protein